MKPRGKKWPLAFAVLVSGLVIWALVASLRDPGEKVQFFTLPDGTKYHFGGATYGANRVPPFFAEQFVSHLPAGLSNWVQTKYGKSLGLMPTFPADKPELQVWMNLVDRSPSNLVGTINPLGILADERGVEGGQPANLSGIFPWPEMSYQFVPRRSRYLEVHVYDVFNSGSTYRHEAGTFRFRNPQYGKFPQWQPEPLPSTKIAGDVQVTLTNCLVGTGPENRFSTVFGLELKQPPNTNEHWAIERIEASDATGNSIDNLYHGQGLDRQGSIPAAFWPDEKAIRLKIWLKRTAGFSKAEVLSFTNVPIPSSSATNEIATTNRVGEFEVELRNDAWKRYRGIMVPKGGGLVMGSYGFGLAVPHGTATVMAEFLKVTTDTGEELHDYARAWDDKGELRFFGSMPANAKSLNMTVSVQKLRTVEFLVKPQ